MERDFEPIPPNREAYPLPNRSLFEVDDRNVFPPESLDETIQQTPPFVSILDEKVEFVAIKDKRPEKAKVIEPLLATAYSKFLILSSPTLTSTSQPIFEPIVVNIFIWDLHSTKRLSETWTFIADPTLDCLSKDSVKLLLDPAWLNAPRSAAFTHCERHTSPTLIAFLDRLLLPDMGVAMDRYYQGGAKSEVDPEKALEGCHQASSMVTFAFATVPLSEIVPTDVDTINFSLTNFRKCHSVSSLSLQSYFEQPPAVQSFPFELKLQLRVEKSPPPGLLRHYCMTGPHMAFVHELLIRPISASLGAFKSLRSNVSNAFVVQVSFSSGGQPVAGTQGQSAYNTRCQTQPADIRFHEEMCIKLPAPVTKDWQIDFRLQNAARAGRRGEVQGGKQIASGSLRLFDAGGGFIPDKEHEIRLNVVGQKPSPDDRFAVETVLRSSLISYSPEVTALLAGNLTNVRLPSREILMPHLFICLDIILDHLPVITDQDLRQSYHVDLSPFSALVEIVKLFPSDPVFSDDSRTLLAYVHYCAFRKPRKESYTQALLVLWLNYFGCSPMDKDKVEFGRIWFFLELLVKSFQIHPFTDWQILVMVTSTLARAISNFRDKNGEFAQIASRYLALFYKDCFELGSPAPVFQMITEHLNNLDCSYELDRECFSDLIRAIFSPKIFIWTVLNAPGKQSMFTETFLPRIATVMNLGQYTEQLFRRLMAVLLQFEPAEHTSLAPHLFGFVRLLDRAEVGNAQQRIGLEFALTLAHFVLYYTELDSTDEELSRTLGKIITLSRPVTSDEAAQPAAAHQMRDIDNAMRISLTVRQPITSGRRTFASIRKSTGTTVPVPTSGDFRSPFGDDQVTLSRRLALCMQAVLIRLIRRVQTIDILRFVAAKLCNEDIAPPLDRAFVTAIRNFLKSNPGEFFRNPESKLASIFVWAVKHADDERVALINDLFSSELQECKTTNRCVALFSRALYKQPPSPDAAILLMRTPLADLVESVARINAQLESAEFRHNAYAYSDLLLRKADLLQRSPDARVGMLLELANYHRDTKYNTEAVVAMLTAAGLIAEYLDRLGRIPNIFGPAGHVIEFFADACPSVVSERIPQAVLDDLPRIRGFATSQYFNEYGILWFLRSTAQALKLAELYELNVKIMQLFTAIAEHRALWRAIADLYQTNFMLWSVIEQASRTNNRNLGSFWYVQFPDRRSFIYRFVGLVELNELSERVSKFFEYHSGGLPVSVTNAGSELPEKLPENKFLVLLRAVQPHFSAEETRRRVTAFLRAFGVGQFFFEIPITTEHGETATRRTIITLDVPMPFIVSRVEFNREHVRSEIVLPIQKACEDLEGKSNEMKLNIRNKDYGSVQRLVHGVLAAGCNGGPGLYVTEFLSPMSPESDYQPALRSALRGLLADVQDGLTLLKDAASGLKPSAIETYEELQNQLASDWQVSLG